MGQEMFVERSKINTITNYGFQLDYMNMCRIRTQYAAPMQFLLTGSSQITTR